MQKMSSLNQLYQQAEANDFHNIIVRWISAFLSNRFQRVRCNGQYSLWGNLRGSVPQGSWLGPVLFVLLIDDLNPSCMAIKYMDDTSLLENVPASNSESHMQTYLDETLHWSHENDMIINPKKTKEIIFNSKNITTATWPFNHRKHSH